MKEKLIIKNFGPIKEVELELGQFNVLIGENATGKSTVAKVLGVCRYFSYIVSDLTNLDSFENGLSEWGLSEYSNDETVISYDCEHYSFVAKAIQYYKEVYDSEIQKYIEIPSINFSFKRIDKTNLFKALILELKKIISEHTIFDEFPFSIPTSFVQKDVATVLDNPFYVPTQRGLQSLFSLGKSSIQNLSDALFNQLAELDTIARSFKAETDIEPFDIVYKNVDGHGFIRKKNDNKFYSLFNAASGYQSTIPIVLLTKFYSETRKKPKTFIIEEPELNLFPSAQNKLMQFLVDKTMNYGNSLLLTTHSPYILTAVNNLLYAFKIGLNHEEEINKIIDKKYWLDPDNVSAYMLLPNGKCVSILDKEGLIKTEKIDSVSGDLNKEFNEMFDIELAIEK